MVSILVYDFLSLYLYIFYIRTIKSGLFGYEKFPFEM